MSRVLNRLLKFILIFFISLFFFSCSDSVPMLVSAAGTVIFDFSDSESAPSIHLSVFTETSSDARRASKISATCRENNFQWVINEPEIISSDGKQWAGYTNLEPVDGEAISLGKYDLIYTDAAGRETNTTFTVSYPKELITSKSADVKKIITSSSEELTALYDKAGELIYFGKPKKNWNENEKILFDYPKAVEKRDCIETVDLSVLCLLPAQNINREKQINNSDDADKTENNKSVSASDKE